MSELKKSALADPHVVRNMKKKFVQLPDGDYYGDDGDDGESDERDSSE